MSSLIAQVEGLLVGQRLGLTAVGRHLRGKTREKDKIKRADRLVGNHHLNGERRAVYGWLTRLLVGGARHPHIIVDWSDVDAARTLCVLRAALVVGGRALPVYEEVHTRYHHPADTGRFLQRLAGLLPATCRPVIVTDAGFKCPWFRAVEALGWYYLGRVRNNDYVCLSGTADWVSNKTLHAQATVQPQALGALALTRYSALMTRAYLYRQPAKGRAKLTVHGQRQRNKASLKQAAGAREPWLLVSNLEPRRNIAKLAVAIYRERMAIEQSFRDLKAHRHGFAFRQSLGRDAARVANLLLIAALAMLATWLTGFVGQQRGLVRGLQANTERRATVLSLFFIGTRLLQQRLRCSFSALRDALRRLIESIKQHAPEFA
ncbi:MAG: IS4 family transposase [Gammaproteobacteria bacterium]|nr:IS4 family transposase [Gammaproteobacteria bacterium]